MSFTLGSQVPDINRHNRADQGRAPNKYQHTPIFPEPVISSSSEEEEEDTIDKQIWQSLINLSTTVPMLPTAEVQEDVCSYHGYAHLVDS